MKKCICPLVDPAAHPFKHAALCPSAGRQGPFVVVAETHDVWAIDHDLRCGCLD